MADETQPVVLKSIVGSKLLLRLPPEIFLGAVLGVGVLGLGLLTALIFDIPFGCIFSLPIYYYFWRKTEKNPYFFDEFKARWIIPSLKNIHKTKGNYYSA